MRVVLDGVAYRDQAHGGISRIFSEILPRICALEPDLRVNLLTAGRLRQRVPAHPHIAHTRLLPVDAFLRPQRLWWRITPHVREWLQKRAVGDSRGQIWHSTYFTRITGWSGATVVTVYDMIYEHFATIYARPDESWLRQQKSDRIRSADAVICISETTRGDVLQYYNLPPDRVWAVPLASSPTFRVRPARTPYRIDRPFLLYVGARAHYKNFLGFMRAYAQWPRQGAVDVVAVGGGPWAARERQALEELGISGQTHLRERVDDDSLCDLYNQAMAFVHPSQYEGFGIPLLEAMACGCPIVASRIPSTLEVAADCPIYFEPSRADSLVAALETAWATGRDSARTQDGLARAQSFSWDRTAQRTLDVYRTVLGG